MWATGNGGLTDDDCNCDGYTTSIYTVSIGCIGDHGLSAYYTELCSSTIAVTFNGGAHREKEENKMVCWQRSLGIKNLPHVYFERNYRVKRRWEVKPNNLVSNELIKVKTPLYGTCEAKFSSTCTPL